MDLKNRTILITGGTRRIGRSIALEIAKAGGNLIIHHRQSVDEANTIKNEIQRLGSRAEIVQADFTDPSKAISKFNKVFNSDTIYALINNASVFTEIGWKNTTLQDWNTHMAVNLTMPFLLSQSFAKSLPEGKSGRIINILDWRALRPGTDHFPYTISKAALAGLTKSMAAALAPKISLNGVALGAILPPSDGAETEGILSSVPYKRWGDLSEVAATILFLLTGPDYITGEIIHLDGGRHLI
jgi:NAD(P)-dependent dehydrogenase (short-subunit alcohol dehydrogenase family)